MTATRVISRSAHWVRAIARHPANRGARLAAVRRAARWHLRTRGGGTTEATVVVDGRTTLMAHPGQFSAVWTLYDGVHEWEEVGFCLDYLRPGDHFVDVGANVGVFSALVGTRQPGVRITAVEPYPPVVADLERNLALNDLDLTVVTDAVGAAPGQAVFEVLERDVLNRLAPDHDTGGGGRGDVAHHGALRIPVAVRTLDDLVGDDPPALIKIDVEGAELDVLRGAQALLAEHTPVLLFEHCGHGAAFGVSPADMRRFLAELGYSIYLLDGQLTPWASDDLPPTPNVMAAKDVAAVRARLASPGGAMVAAPVRVDVRYSDDDRVDARARLPRRPVSVPGRRWAAAALAGALAVAGTGAAYALASSTPAPPVAGHTAAAPGTSAMGSTIPAASTASGAPAHHVASSPTGAGPTPGPGATAATANTSYVTLPVLPELSGTAGVSGLAPPLTVPTLPCVPQVTLATVPVPCRLVPAAVGCSCP